MIEIDLDIVKRIALLTVALVVSFWTAFKGTPDLDDVKDRGWYRFSFGLTLTWGMLWIFELLGWVERVG